MKVDKKKSEVDDEPGGCRSQLVNEQTWPQVDKESITCIDDLLKICNLPEINKEKLEQVVNIYPLRITPYYLSLIKDIHDPSDPILRQCMPSLAEIEEKDFESMDPLAEEKTSPTNYLVHRYPDRVLFLVTGKCFMYCRHCTRKRIWKKNNFEPSLKNLEKSLEYIRENKNIREVVVSGGDPLTLSEEKVDCILTYIHKIKHVEVIRIGTRTPVVFPKRITGSLCSTLRKYDNLWINVQFNHPREITPQSTAACRRLQRQGIPISNQSVLLKGINDDPKIMKELCHKLQRIRVRPYYLFQCDPVSGTSGFRTSVWKGVEIIEKMRGFTSGMCVPTFVVDGTEGMGKVPLSPNYFVSSDERAITLKNYAGETFIYPDFHKDKADTEIKIKAKQTIAITFNLKKHLSSADEDEEYDEIETIEAIKQEIESLGFGVVLLEQDKHFMRNLMIQKIDFVLNIAEGKGKSRSRESQIPCILESLNIPYSGSDPIALGIALDKGLTTQVLKAKGIPVPQSYVVGNIDDIETLPNIFKGNKRFIIKPRWEGSSKGIFLNSLVGDFKELKEKVSKISNCYNQPALVEEFLDNDEVTVGVCGNEQPFILGMMKIMPRNTSKYPFIYSIENKREWKEKIKYESKSAIPEKIQKRIERSAIDVFSALELRDIARIDFRMDKNNIPKVIDVNPLPGLSPVYSDLPIMIRLSGETYSSLIKTILEVSFRRCGLKWDQASKKLL